MEVCDLAAARGVSLLPAAEEESANAGIHTWSLNLQRQFNSRRVGQVVVYNTYQAYLRSTPGRLAEHLAIASKEGFPFGVKLVRGAYLSSEPRHLIWSTKEETDRTYDLLMGSLLRRKNSDALQVPDPLAFPFLRVVLATHNMESVQKARAIRAEQAKKGEDMVALAYAQLQGMADEVSCELLQSEKTCRTSPFLRDNETPAVYKCTAWGTVGECLAYLVRRASENKEAAMRTEQTRKAMAEELCIRLKGVLHLPRKLWFA